ncbi:MAG TPA: threonine/serine dehydratase [Stellaceae bacterium]|jgi:threonine dehydratase|nr:threonine/serine dehydratase [Stellaceae bacterium]
MTAPLPPTADDVRAAAARLAGHALLTPLLEASALSEKLGLRVLLKPETLQRTGSFKFRGAFNRLAALTPEERKHGVVAFSSGNHAQGVAAAAKHFGMAAAIVMPDDAPAIKRANTAAYGAELVLYDRLKGDREAIARTLAEERGATLVPSYDDPFIMAGQGTVGLEIAHQCATLGISPGAVVVPISGGGLISGIALALGTESPATSIWGAEPRGFDDHARSLAAGRIVPHDHDATTLCDALMAAKPGNLTFAVNKERLSGAAVVDDDEVRQAMAYAFNKLKLVVEPGGSVGLAALLAGKLPKNLSSIVVVLSGGNVDPETFMAVLAAADR